ncbi:hypothetical protein [Mesorhizobium sp. M7A.F.Ca.US.011.01.1.1]|uniref:hypothetical protein n=1 Tax=Mesorhizobium sp. M7A.F.Ca.US.011.01.1.1 TaxID=2496741 RepID=UPI0026B85C15
MIQVKARRAVFVKARMMWNSIQSAPYGRHLKLAVFDEEGAHALVFPCIKSREGWKNAVTGARVDIRPTHWREWDEEKVQASTGNPLEGSP